MTTFHRLLGAVIVAAFVTIMLGAVTLRLIGRIGTPTWLRGLQHWTENLLVVQLLGGLVLLAIGRRAGGGPVAWLHYLYGSLFPFIAVVGGRLAALRRERFAYVGLGWGALVAFGLTLRAVQSGCGTPLAELSTCLLR
ncbi:MAG: hypothetical protein RLZZ272_1764 [Actinomycetota bacterium]|jgi:hypothetical protein